MKHFIEPIALNHNLDPKLVEAFCRVESSLNPDAYRYEKNWKYFFEVDKFRKKQGVSFESEEVMQKFSFGPMQVMGSVARELGFDGPLFKLCEPAIGLEYGCKKLEALFKKYHTLGDVAAAYNAGSPRRALDHQYVNQHYVDAITKAFNDVTNGR